MRIDPTRTATYALAMVTLLGASSGLASCYTGDGASPTQGTNDGGGEGGNAESGSGDCGGPPTLSAIQDSIFTKGCAFGSCHGGANPAAGLDLSSGRACGSLLNQNSCVFSNRTRVVPGHPEQSYLFHKVAGDDLGANPDGTCAGLANGTPSRMPIGGEPLCQGQVEQIRAWIAAGASCDVSNGDAGGDGRDGDSAGDASGDVTEDGDGAGPVGVANVTSSQSIFNAGQAINATVVLVAPAPAPGVSVTLSATDPTVLAVPSAVFVPGGQASGSFAVTGLRPGHATVQATAGGNTGSLDELVLGLYIAEIDYRSGDGTQWVRLFNVTSTPIDLSQYSLGAGHGDYTNTRAQLAGTIPASGCFVVGGPTSDAYNGYPSYSQVLHLQPDIMKGGSAGAGVALFGVPALSLTATTLPIDAVVYGTSNSGHLLARDGSVAIPVSPDVYPGDSLMMLGGSWVDEYPPYPSSCGL